MEDLLLLDKLVGKAGATPRELRPHSISLFLLLEMSMEPEHKANSLGERREGLLELPQKAFWSLREMPKKEKEMPLSAEVAVLHHNIHR